jgi:hypothetical protein
MIGTVTKVNGLKQTHCFIADSTGTVYFAHRLDFANPALMYVGSEVEFTVKAVRTGPRPAATNVVRTPTGSLIGGIAGGEEGYRHGGVAGGVAGGLAGLAAPEILGSPSVQMAAARGLYGGGTKGLTTGAVLQASKKKNPYSST